MLKLANKTGVKPKPVQLIGRLLIFIVFATDSALR
jgi:hypothetical protein